MNRISLYGNGNETAGSVADRQSVTAKLETAGGVGARIYQQEPEPEVKMPPALDKDTVSFRGKDDSEKGTSALGVLGALAFSAAAVIGGLACVKKYGVIDKLKEGKVKDFLIKYGNPAAETCHKWCAFLKEKAVNLFKGKKV